MCTFSECAHTHEAPLLGRYFKRKTSAMLRVVKNAWRHIIYIFALCVFAKKYTNKTYHHRDSCILRGVVCSKRRTCVCWGENSRHAFLARKPPKSPVAQNVRHLSSAAISLSTFDARSFELYIRFMFRVFITLYDYTSHGVLEVSTMSVAQRNHSLESFKYYSYILHFEPYYDLKSVSFDF